MFAHNVQNTQNKAAILIPFYYCYYSANLQASNQRRIHMPDKRIENKNIPRQQDAEMYLRQHIEIPNTK